MSHRGTSPNSLKSKFTPKTIHNKIDIDIDFLKNYFKNHTLKQCADKFECSKSTIKRRLKAAGVDTSIHNHSDLAYKINRESKKNLFIASKEKLYDLYIVKNLDTKSIGELLNCHYNTVRHYVHKFGFKKSPKDVAQSMKTRHYKKHGYAHPAQRPDVLEKTRRSSQRVNYLAKNGKKFKFKSLFELSFALFLDSNDVEWYYEEMKIPYVDNMSGVWRIYIIDFTIVKGDEVEWVEVKPNKNMIPEDKRIYASRRAEESGIKYRGLTDYEVNQSKKLLLDGYRNDQINFTYYKPKSNARQVSYYFKSEDELKQFEIPSGWEKFAVKKHSNVLWALKIRRPEIKLSDLKNIRFKTTKIFNSKTAMGTWNPNKPSAGHCDVVAMLLQSIYGGKLVTTTINKIDHWFNKIGNQYVDLTGDQFGLNPVRIWDNKTEEFKVKKQKEISSKTKKRYELFLEQYNKI